MTVLIRRSLRNVADMGRVAWAVILTVWTLFYSWVLWAWVFELLKRIIS